MTIIKGNLRQARGNEAAMALKSKIWHVRGWCRVFALTIAWAISGSVFAQPGKANEQLEAVFKDWKIRQGILKSARYVLAGETEFKDESLPPGNPIRPRRTVLLLDLAKKRYRLEGSDDCIYLNGKDNDSKAWEYRTYTHTSAYDGEALQSLRHKKENRIDDDLYDLAIGKGNLGPGAQFPSEIWPIFMAHGIVPTVHSLLFVDKLPLTHDPDDFDIAGRQLLRGRNYLLLRTEPTGNAPLSDEFWIDPQQKSAIHRHVYFSGSNPWFRFDIFWKNTDYGWWVDHWSETWTKEGSVRRINHLRVETFEANLEVTDADFKLPAEPGMKVIVSEGPPPGQGLNPFKAATRTYIISPTGSWDEISATGFTTQDGKELPPESNKKWLAWTIGLGISLAALLFYALRPRRKAAAL